MFMHHKHSTSIRWIVAVMVIVALVLTACGKDKKEDKATPVPPTPETFTIGVALSNLSNPFFATLRDGAESEAQRQNATLVVEDAADDAAQQTSQVQAMIDQGVNALLINPVDADAIVSSIEAANAAGIPVLTIDRSASGGTILSHIASDNEAGGKMAGDFLAERINKTGNIVELQGPAGNSAADARGKGFDGAIATYPDIHIVAKEIANWNRDEAQTAFAQILADNADIVAVFAQNDEMVLGAIAAAKEAGRDGIVFVGFDAIDDAIAAVEDGSLTATIAQQPSEMGRLGVETAVSALKGESVPSTIPVDLALVTK